ncbi:MAG: histidine phosphatase family protein [Spirochaetes bacterium]|nr:histidine phosphatase family protein [Spirochaetota bacterium]
MVDFSSLSTFPSVDFYFLRHGKSEGNLQSLVQGRLNYPLSAIGREQAEATGKWFVGKPIVHVFTTPLERGKETARIVSEVASLPVPEELPSLIELDTGIFTGITLEEAKTQYPELYQQFLKESWEGVPGAEKILHLKERATLVWNTLINRVKEASNIEEGNPVGVLVVSHAGLLQWIVKLTLGSQSWFPLLPMGDCGIYQLSLQGTVTRWALLNFQAPGVTGHR